ncbi:hypothetical protein [Natroniella sp. ANB-PHB2]|uniref:hypothetical protein n=1 Tax=Natroniella sp. ANB-PHB2 TaxID=3384444 RepID=UPI0038D39DA4
MNLVNLFTMINELFKLEQEDLIELKEFLEEMIVDNKEEVRTEVAADSIRNDQVVYNQFFINLHKCPKQSSMKGGDEKEDKTEINKDVSIAKKIDLKNYNQEIMRGGEKMVDQIGISEKELEEIAKEGLSTQSNGCSNNNEFPIEDTVDFCCFIQVPANFDIRTGALRNPNNYRFAFNVDNKLSCCLEKDTVNCTVKVNCNEFTVPINLYTVKMVGCIEYMISIRNAVEGDQGGRINPDGVQPGERVDISCTGSLPVNNIVGAVRADECDSDPCADFNPLAVEGKIDVTDTEVIEKPGCPNVRLVKVKGQFQLPSDPCNDEPPIDPECGCKLTGSGSAEVNNPEDDFHEGTAVIVDLDVCPNCTIEGSSLEYKVTHRGDQLNLVAETFEIECIELEDRPYRMEITGEGTATRGTGPGATTGSVDYEFEVWDGGEGPPGTDQFRMVIEPQNPEQDELAHDSGVVDHRGSLTIEDCP